MLRILFISSSWHLCFLIHSFGFSTTFTRNFSVSIFFFSEIQYSLNISSQKFDKFLLNLKPESQFEKANFHLNRKFGKQIFNKVNLTGSITFILSILKSHPLTRQRMRFLLGQNTRKRNIFELRTQSSLNSPRQLCHVVILS